MSSADKNIFRCDLHQKKLLTGPNEICNVLNEHEWRMHKSANKQTTHCTHYAITHSSLHSIQWITTTVGVCITTSFSASYILTASLRVFSNIIELRRHIQNFNHIHLTHMTMTKGWRSHNFSTENRLEKQQKTTSVCWKDNTQKRFSVITTIIAVNEESYNNLFENLFI